MRSRVAARPVKHRTARASTALASRLQRYRADGRRSKVEARSWFRAGPALRRDSFTCTGRVCADEISVPGPSRLARTDMQRSHARAAYRLAGARGDADSDPGDGAAADTALG